MLLMYKSMNIFLVLTIILLSSCTTIRWGVGQKTIKNDSIPAQNDVWHAAKLRGVSFRAIGQEPGWLLEITDGDKIILNRHYGQDTLSFTYMQPVVDQSKRLTVYQVDDSLSILIEGKACEDVMSGELFQAQVTITFQDSILKGCGRALY